MIAAVLLRRAGVADLPAALQALRPVTALGVGAARLAWSIAFADRMDAVAAQN